MRYIVSGTKMKAIEQNTINNIGIPAIVLMERAALSVRDELLVITKSTDKVLVVCGVGNNGADGLAVARLMCEAGFFCAVYIVGDINKATEEWRLQYSIIKNNFFSDESNKKISFVTTCNFNEYNIIVDAIFGIGLTRNIEGCYKTVVEEINSSDMALVIAVDLPSGINSDTAEVMGIAVKADKTITFEFEKIGTALYAGKAYAGEVIIKNIGISLLDKEIIKTECYTHTPDDYKILPERKPYSNKGTYGKLFVVAGSANMTGAAWFCATSAYRCGTGLVSVYATAPQVKKVVQNKLPEAVIIESDSEDSECVIKSAAHAANAIVCGPGIGMDCMAEAIVDMLLGLKDTPIVLDADGLNIIAVKKWQLRLENNIIITPHLGEMARLTGLNVETIRGDLLGTAAGFASKYKCTVVLKDAVTVIADEQGAFYVNSSGNSGMATAGSGDVLSGIIGAMYAMYPSKRRLAVSIAVYIHGLCGDYAKKKTGERPLLARDILGALQKVMGEDIWKQLM